MQVRRTSLDRPIPCLDLARNGDNEAFGELVRPHYCKCVDVATSFLPIATMPKIRCRWHC
jgi:hypothetical protein